MAHQEQINFCKSVKEFMPDFFKGVSVLDIGSLDINGNNRYLFDNYDYTGIDIGEGILIERADRRLLETRQRVAS